MLKINSVILNPAEDCFENVKLKVLKKTALKAEDIEEIKIFRRSIDARKKNQIKINYSVLLKLKDEKNENRFLKKESGLFLL